MTTRTTTRRDTRPDNVAWAMIREFSRAVAALVRGLLQRPLASYYLLVASSALLLTIGLAMVFSATSVE